jgi:hypothetical protein
MQVQPGAWLSDLMSFFSVVCKRIIQKQPGNRLSSPKSHNYNKTNQIEMKFG